jgi:hypothetical protein
MQIFTNGFSVFGLRHAFGGLSLAGRIEASARFAWILAP